MTEEQLAKIPPGIPFVQWEWLDIDFGDNPMMSDKERRLLAEAEADRLAEQQPAQRRSITNGPPKNSEYEFVDGVRHILGLPDSASFEQVHNRIQAMQDAFKSKIMALAPSLFNDGGGVIAITVERYNQPGMFEGVRDLLNCHGLEKVGLLILREGLHEISTADESEMAKLGWVRLGSNALQGMKYIFARDSAYCDSWHDNIACLADDAFANHPDMRNDPQRRELANEIASRIMKHCFETMTVAPEQRSGTTHIIDWSKVADRASRLTDEERQIAKSGRSETVYAPDPRDFSKILEDAVALPRGAELVAPACDNTSIDLPPNFTINSWQCDHVRNSDGVVFALEFRGAAFANDQPVCEVGGSANGVDGKVRNMKENCDFIGSYLLVNTDQLSHANRRVCGKCLASAFVKGDSIRGTSKRPLKPVEVASLIRRLSELKLPMPDSLDEMPSASNWSGAKIDAKVALKNLREMAKASTGYTRPLAPTPHLKENPVEKIGGGRKPYRVRFVRLAAGDQGGETFSCEVRDLADAERNIRIANADSATIFEAVYSDGFGAEPVDYMVLQNWQRKDGEWMPVLEQIDPTPGSPKTVGAAVTLAEAEPWEACQGTCGNMIRSSELIATANQYRHVKLCRACYDAAGNEVR